MFCVKNTGKILKFRTLIKEMKECERKVDVKFQIRTKKNRFEDF